MRLMGLLNPFYPALKSLESYYPFILLPLWYRRSPLGQLPAHLGSIMFPSRFSALIGVSACFTLELVTLHVDRPRLRALTCAP